MNVAFRTDASLQIGTGHVMRCLTLADALRERGANCRFVCREHPGNLLSLVRDRGYQVYALPSGIASEHGSLAGGAEWLGVSETIDVGETRAALVDEEVDWLIVDHYGVSARWEVQLRAVCRKLMVIDDLADRPHDCDLLLNQNLGRSRKNYADLLPNHCTVLVGPRFALLGPDFALLRPYSLSRRAPKAELQHLLITMGGVDRDDATGKVLDALDESCIFPGNSRISVIMGSQAPWIKRVRIKAAQLPWPTEVMVNVRNMAEIMAGSDLAIGAAGTTSWERCCLGVPSMIFVLASNQQEIAENLHGSGAARMTRLQTFKADFNEFLARCISVPSTLASMSASASHVTSGVGCDLVCDTLLQKDGYENIAVM